ncbi:btb (poz) domain-containing 2a-related [Anaeramoeba flamelloides]|uniref:Btb (Poz) domain-containing 2a-related n=1 Tax=Anaeramoeba flamelloides TaxID=1746091 RepID=A0ABQ8ZA58_9EUKA|nr:btb (poz) domain-containing 2a-related [Anaeramoeba flamelloides]
MSTSIKRILKSLVNQQKYANIKFLVGKTQEVIWGHKLLLCLSSSYWETALNQEGKKEDPLVVAIPNYEPPLFKNYLKYVYTRRLKLNVTLCFQLMGLSKEYRDDDFFGYCIKYLKNQLNYLNCFEIMDVCAEFQLKDLELECLQILCQNSEKLFAKSDCLLKLTKENVSSVLQASKLKATEIQIFKALYHWSLVQKKLLIQKLEEEQHKQKNEEKQEEIKKKIKEATVNKIIEPFLGYINLDLMNFQDLRWIAKTKVYPSKLILDHSLKLTKLETKFLPNRLSRFNPKREKGTSEIKVLLLGFCRRGKKHLLSIKQSIMSQGIENVDMIEPDLDYANLYKLMQYDCVVLRSANTKRLLQSQELGNNLSTFVQSGRGLVVFAINTLHQNSDTKIKGAIVDDHLIPLPIQARESSKDRMLGDVLHPNHPIMKGVKTFETKDYTHIIASKTVYGGKVIAKWTNGFPLIVEKRAQSDWGSVVVLNFHPTSTAITDSCGKAWLQETDGAKIIANSVSYAAYRKLY